MLVVISDDHGAILFRIEKPEHYKGYNDPVTVYRAMFEWNNLNVEVRNAKTKTHLLGADGRTTMPSLFTQK